MPYNATVNKNSDFARGIGYWVSLVPYDYQFTGRIKYIKTEGEKTKVYFEIWYFRQDLRFRLIKRPFFYIKNTGKIFEWVLAENFHPISEITIVECEK